MRSLSSQSCEQTYVDNDDPVDRHVAREVLGLYSRSVADSILDSLETDENSDSDASKTLWVVGHAIYLPAAVLGIASLIGTDEVSKEMIASTATREAEGYVIDLNECTCSYLLRLN